MKLTEKFKWPLWQLLVAFVLSLMLTPAINFVGLGGRFFFERICFAGYIVFAVLYLKGWLKTGRKIEWLACLSGTFFMPALAMLATSYLEPLPFRK